MAAADEMSSVRVPNRGGSLWFLLSGILILIAVIAIVFGQGNARWVAPAVIGALASAALTYALYGAKRHIDLGDQIVVRYFLRERVILWSEVAFVELDREEMRTKTGIPFVSISTENHTLTLRLREGGAEKRTDTIYFFGRGGGFGSVFSFVFNSSRISTMARSNCWSLPANSVGGSLSTTISGSTPLPSIIHSLPSIS